MGHEGRAANLEFELPCVLPLQQEILVVLVGKPRHQLQLYLAVVGDS